MIIDRINEKSNASYDVIGVGSALLDIIVNVDRELLTEMDLAHGGMKLIDAQESSSIMKIIGTMEREKIPGGSAANTIAGVSRLGGRGAFIGSVGTDEYGDLYVMETRGGRVEPLVQKYDGMTGHAITFITPDSERTFATHLGAALQLEEKDISLPELEKARILHLEGYLLEPENLRKAALKAMAAAKEYNIPVSLDISDPGLIDRIKDVFLDVIPQYVDILFANETEALAYTGVEEEKALAEIARSVDIAVVKLGGRGSLIQYNNEVFTIPGFDVDVVNTNGAGDMYAAGLLYGLCHGYSLEKAGTIGSYAASRVVGQQGARLAEDIDFSFITD